MLLTSWHLLKYRKDFTGSKDFRHGYIAVFGAKKLKTALFEG